MPGSTTFFGVPSDEDAVNHSESGLMSSRQPPPVAPRTTSVSIQPWQSATPGGEHGFGDNRHARSASMDSLESSGSSSSGGGSSTLNSRSSDSTAVEYIPTRTAGKATKLPSHNPLQFVKVHSPLYRKAEHQIKLTKEVKTTREALKEGEEEWQSNLDNWKSRRRKVSEKVIQRAEEMRQIEAEEQLRQEHYLQQQRKIKKFSEIVEKRSSSRSYNLDLYIGQGDDSGLGGTPEPDEIIDEQNSILRSDTSEGMTSEGESIDSDVLKSDRIIEKDPPKVPQKPQMRLKREATFEEFENDQSVTVSFLHNTLNKDDNYSSAEPSDIDGLIGDSETISSEEDISYSPCSVNFAPTASSFKNQLLKDQNGIKNDNFDSSASTMTNHEDNLLSENADKKLLDWQTKAFSIAIKAGDNRGFGFTIKGGKDEACSAYIDSIAKYGPADVIGLKEGDEIISLNGELAADYSHASLIFSIKQAVYTGILDLIISRSKKNAPLLAEMKTKSTSRKSSFAEKLALFSSGANIGTSNGEDKSSVTSLQSGEVKSESLVLRRRSAFENGKRDSNVAHRRSSCVSQGNVSSITENAEKRLSVDFTLSQYNSQDNASVKKGPPPPVPVKPKLKPKTFHDLNKTESIKSTNYKENIGCIVDSDSVETTTECSLSVTNHEKHFYKELPAAKINGENCNADMELKTNKEESFNSYPLSTNNVPETFNNIKFLETNNSIECQNMSTFTLNTNDLSNSDDKNVYQLTDDSQCLTIDVTSSEIGDTVVEEKVLSPQMNLYLETKCNISYSEKNEFADINELDEPGPDSLISTDMLLAKPLFKDSEKTESNILSSDISAILPHFPSDFTDDSDLFRKQDIGDEVFQHDEDDISETNNYVSPDAYNLNALENNEGVENICNVDNVVNMNSNDIDNLEESINNIQLNPSPLCLPLEKIDEDDVISASTTTSSETPDTETVIETLPANLSPLPNDESNGEESSKPLNYQNMEPKSSTGASADNPSYSSSSGSNCLDNPPQYIETCEDVPTEKCDYMINSVSNQETVYTEDQDDEYCRELDESIDQITSLDVIDEIEHRLMLELEQQGQVYEEIDSDLTNKVEEDVNKQWLYFSEESELLEDLTPRNLEPPREPPPPPPPAEIDIMPMTRTNSTKRIKKEIWRRRSDFLGLHSAEGFDVDHILPPPPGLEEILKQEREQNQWLEKRLSLAETDISAPLYVNEPASIETQDFIQSVYSDYLEENEDSHCAKWKDNLAEDNIFEQSSEYSFVPPPDISPVPDESHKAIESPQHKAKQNIHTLGAAPKAKIMDSNKWITEKIMPVNKKCIEPMFRQTTYNQNYWLAQDEQKRNVQSSDNFADRRYSMPPFSNTYPDVTVRTWGDREYEFQKQRPRSAVWNSSANGGDIYEPFSQKQKVLHTHSLNSQNDLNADVNILESEEHKCSCCGKGLCEGSAMGIEALRLYFHIECFCCCLCQMQLGNGSCGTDVQVKNNQLYCPNCFTVD